MSASNSNLYPQGSEQLYAAPNLSTENVYVETADEGPYIGKKQPSKRGKHDVLVYYVPNSQKSYAFAFARKNLQYDSYICMQCKKSGQWRSIKVCPGKAHHKYDIRRKPRCDARDKAEKKVQELKKDVESAGKKPIG